MKYIQGDILSNLPNNKPVLILHGCNCFHTMGAGIAKYLSSRYPQILEADKKFGPKGDNLKLGWCCYVMLNEHLYIANCYTQYHYGKRFGPPVNYSAIESCLLRAGKVVPKSYEIRSPKIGCGLAGGDWNVVEPLFEKYLPNAIIYEKKETYHYGK